MRTIETVVYQFSELNDAAKEKARNWVRGLDDYYSFSEDNLSSINAFCEHFSVTLQGWSVSPWGHAEFKHDAENSNFRGLKLKHVDPENMPTGYYLDCVLWGEFHKQFKQTGNALHAFNEALDTGFTAWRSDWESSYDDEQVDDWLEINGFEFTEDGEKV